MDGKENNKAKKSIEKEEMVGLLKEVDQKLEGFIKSGRYKDVLLMMGNLGKYSLFNQIYILIQKPDAKTVNGVKGWNYLGRSVKRGEKGIRIIAPIVVKPEKDTLGEENSKTKEGKPVIKTYKSSYVFDISQTSGKELVPFKVDENTKVGDKSLIKDALISLMEKEGYSFNYAMEEELGKECYGLCNHKEKKIWILKGMPDLQEISTLLHECAHALAHNPYKKGFKGLRELPSRDIKEIEAESIACVVCSYLGLDTEQYSFSYITGWSEGNISKFRKNMDVISLCSRKLIQAIDESLYERKKQDSLLLNSMQGIKEESVSI